MSSIFFLSVFVPSMADLGLWPDNEQAFSRSPLLLAAGRLNAYGSRAVPMTLAVGFSVELVAVEIDL